MALVMTCLTLACALFLDLGIGASLFSITSPDGTWWQQPFPHHFDTTAIAGRAGLGYRFNEHWSTTLAYTRLGTVKSTAQAVSDQDYDPVGHRCLRNCNGALPFTVHDTLQGGEWTVKYALVRSGIANTILPFVKVGGAVMVHDLTMTIPSSHTFHLDYHGLIPMILAGGGLCYRHGVGVNVCADATYYYGIGSGSQGFPLSTRIWTPMLTIQVPLW